MHVSIISTLVPGNCMWLSHLPILSHRMYLGRVIYSTVAHRTLLTQINALSLELFASLMPTTAGCTARAKLQNKGNQTESRANPHESQHLHANMSFDVQVGISIGEYIGKNFKHHCCYYRSNDGDESRGEGENEHGNGAQQDEGAPSVGKTARGGDWGPVGAGCNPVLDCLWRSGRDSQRTDEDHDKVEDGRCEEEAEHPVGDSFGEIEWLGDVGRQGNYSAFN